MADIDLTEIEAFQSARGPKCVTGKLITGDDPRLSKKDRLLLKHATHPGATVQLTAITAWLASKDVKVGNQGIGRHRKGQCSCDQS